MREDHPFVLIIALAVAVNFLSIRMIPFDVGLAYFLSKGLGAIWR